MRQRRLVPCPAEVPIPVPPGKSRLHHLNACGAKAEAPLGVTRRVAILSVPSNTINYMPNRTWQEVFADEVALRALVARVGQGGYVAVLRELGRRPHVYYYNRLRDACHLYDIPPPSYVPPRKVNVSRVPRVSAFEDAKRVRAAVAYGSINAALRALGAAPCGGNYRRLKEACARFGIPVPDHRARSVYPPPPVLPLQIVGRPSSPLKVEIEAVLMAARVGMTKKEACKYLCLPATRSYVER